MLSNTGERLTLSVASHVLVSLAFVYLKEREVSAAGGVRVHRGREEGVNSGGATVGGGFSAALGSYGLNDVMGCGLVVK